MATRKKATKTMQTASQEEFPEDVEIKEEQDSEEGEESDDSMHQSSMSLDVLAQVASETLERSTSDDSTNTSPAYKKQKVRPGSSSKMTLQQIRMLSDKALVNTFAELSGDELRRKYTYQCYLMPDKCQETFSSFGNEAKARQGVKAHLLAHIGSLLQEDCTPGRGKTKFTAEPLSAIQKRLAGAKKAQKSKKRKNSTSNSPRSPGTSYINQISRPVTVYTSIKPRPRNLEEVQAAIEADDDDWSPKAQYRGKKGRKSAKSKRSKKWLDQESDIDENTGEMEEDIGGMTVSHEEDALPPDEATALEAFKQQGRLEEEREMQKRIREQEIIDNLLQRQPFKDHSYTTVYGPPVIVEAYTSDALNYDDDGPEGTSQQADTDYPARTVKITLNDEHGTSSTNIHIPILRMAKLPPEPEGTPVVSAEEVVQSWANNGPDDTDEMSHDSSYFSVLESTRKYPPMPKSDVSKKGKIMYPEEYTSSDEDLPPPKKAPFRKAAKNHPQPENVSDWERKIALKCIRELRVKKKEDVSLVCKICKDKAFTATATLMYHYRSHAGIKPFVCLICNTTFTRQHSLNYHMLIHNNQSRFTCKDCGRKFRHPSHFKEHMRRHTGETPFHCMDCPLRFKTRNTYKRHLKTRHGKLLTADGIQYGQFLAKDDSAPKARQVRYRGAEASKQGMVVLQQEEGDRYENVIDDGDVDDDDDDDGEYIQEFGEPSNYTA